MNWKKLLNSGRLRTTGRIKDARTEFESDFGRIIFSPAVRRMHDKTQVFPLTTDDNIHSRLTHSLEVMSIGYTMGVRICEDLKIQKRVEKDNYHLFREIPVIMKNICLLHDIGNPPFGHFGETVIQEYFKKLFNQSLVGKNISECRKLYARKRNKLVLELDEEQMNDFLYFDGNAQGLRVITKLQRLDDMYGLNLTYATLSAFIKYPNHSLPNKKTLNSKKLGVFYSEKKYFEEISSACGTKNGDVYMRHPLSYLMEAADSICYLTMDIEDGFNKGLYDMKYLFDKLDSDGVPENLRNTIKEINEKEVNDTKKIVSLRIALIQELVDSTIKEFIDNLEEIENNKYDRELIDEQQNSLVNILNNICKDKIFTSRDINSLELTGHSVMNGLLDYYIDFLILKDNKAYNKRATTMISSSIVDIAIDENFDAIIEKRKKELKKELKKKDNKEKLKKINKFESELKASEIKLNGIEKELKELEERLNNNSDNNNIIKIVKLKEDKKSSIFEIKQKKLNLWQEVKPNINDLDDYYKLRIIVDYISGMTDQFALNHYRKISGQKIN
jgi:dGTPase